MKNFFRVAFYSITNFISNARLFIASKIPINNFIVKKFARKILVVFNITKFIPKPFLSVEIPISDICNLNCAYCDHFCSLIPKNCENPFMEIEVFKKDLIRLKNLQTSGGGGAWTD
jgi:sulfatase maturation enzyme AslB (radical SAM superfamily)